MNKILISSIVVATIATVIIIATKDKTPDLQPEKGYVSCTTLCQNKIPSLCSDELEYSQDNCEANCNTWTNSLKTCVSKADDCEQLDLDFSRSADDLAREAVDSTLKDKNKISKASHCTIVDDDYSDIAEYEDVKETQFGCSGACYKYKQCAGFGEDITEETMNEAYDSCFEQCQTWSENTLNCMKKVKINSPMDCMPLTKCGLIEYHNQGF